MFSKNKPVSLSTTYTDYPTTAANTEQYELLTLTTFDAKGDFHQSWQEPVAKTLGVTANTTLKISEKTSTTVKGNFSGIIYDKSLQTKRLVTEGEFYLPILL